MATWLTAASATLNADDDGWANTLRMVISSAQISNTGLAQIRVTLQAGNAQGYTFDKAYVEMAAAAGDAYDFQATPKQLLFGGAAGYAIAAGNNVVSDSLLFSIEASKNLVFSVHGSGDATHDMARQTTGVTGWQGYFKAGDDASTTNATGYTSLAAGRVPILAKVEVAALDTSNFFPFF